MFFFLILFVVLFQLLWTKLILSEFWQLWIIWPQCSRVMEMWQYLGVRLISCSVTNPNLTILGYEKEPHFWVWLVVETIHWRHTCPPTPTPLLRNKKPLTKLEICRHNTRGPVRQENRMLSIARLSCACKCSDWAYPPKQCRKAVMYVVRYHNTNLAPITLEFRGLREKFQIRCRAGESVGKLFHKTGCICSFASCP